MLRLRLIASGLPSIGRSRVVEITREVAVQMNAINTQMHMYSNDKVNATIGETRTSVNNLILPCVPS